MERYENCARRIQAYWRLYRNRKLFKLLVNTVRSAEKCLTAAALRQLCPREAELLTDPTMRFKLRFRFAGPQFPPSVVFKVFHIGVGRHYLSGKNLFTPSNKATAETCTLMSNRRFLDLMSVDESHRPRGAVVEPQDVICITDFMQYSSHLDELPACLGGRENGWRFLSHKVLLREDSRSGRRAPVVGDLKQVLSFEHLSLSHHSARQLYQRGVLMSTRRSARAKNIAAHKRRLYTPGEAGRLQLLSEQRNMDDINNCKTEEQKRSSEKYDIRVVLPSVLNEDSGDSSSDSEWEEKAEELCNWSKQLTLHAVDAPEFV